MSHGAAPSRLGFERHILEPEGDDREGVRGGGTGVIGRRLVPLLVARGHKVVATTTRPEKRAAIESQGATAVLMDGLDAASVGEAVATAEPDVIVHQMTSIPQNLDVMHPEREFATTTRLRTEGLDHLVAAADSLGGVHLVAQSYASWNGIRHGGWVKTEADPLDPEHLATPSLQHIDDVVLPRGGAVLRYGWLYGPGASDGLVGPIRKRQFPLVGGRCRPHLVGARGRRGERYRVGCRATRGRRIQHRGRRPGRRVRVAALPGVAARREAAPAGARLGAAHGGRRVRGVDDDRGPRLLERQGEAGARMAARFRLLA